MRTPATALLAPGMVGRRGALGRGAVAGALGVAGLAVAVMAAGAAGADGGVAVATVPLTW